MGAYGIIGPCGYGIGAGKDLERQWRDVSTRGTGNYEDREY
jgi:hypothetical protein